MKKLIIIFIFILSANIILAQAPVQRGNSYVTPVDDYFRAGKLLGLPIVSDTLVFTGTNGLDSLGSQIYVRSGANVGAWIRQFNGVSQNQWVKSGSGGTILGGPITSLPALGDNPGTNISSGDFITSEFYQSQYPTATSTQGVNLEFESAQTINYTLSWSAGRQAATQPLSTVVVAGINQSFTQPSAPGTVSGTQAVAFPANTNVTYSNVVTTTDGKVATASTTFSFLPQRYSGWINVSDTAGIGTFGYDDSKIYGLTNELTASKVKTWNTGTPTGVQIYVYAYYNTSGTLNNLILNGFPSLDAFNEVQRNFTNALGYTGQWIIYWNKNGQTLSSDIIAN